MSAKKAPKPIIDRLEDLFDKDNLLDYQAPKESLPGFDGLDATNDMECCINFLYRYRKNPATFNAYRREVERLLQWSWHIHGGSILDHDDDDLDRYMTFVIEPPLAWIGDKTVARFKSKNGLRVSNPEWRPFVKTVSKVVTKTAEDAGADESNYLGRAGACASGKVHTPIIILTKKELQSDSKYGVATERSGEVFPWNIDEFETVTQTLHL